MGLHAEACDFFLPPSHYSLTLLLNSIVVRVSPCNECHSIPVTRVWPIDTHPSHRSIRLELQIVYLESENKRKCRKLIPIHTENENGIFLLLLLFVCDITQKG